MTAKLLYDSKGATLQVVEYEGYLIQAFKNVIENVNGLPRLQLRDDDVVISTYPKSGTHWIWEICMRILKNVQDESFVVPFNNSFVEFSDQRTVAEQASPRALISHLPVGLLTRVPELRQRKMVHMIRNPKDVAVSFYTQTRAMDALYDYKGEWSGFFESFLQGQVDSGSWFDHVLAWERFRKSQPAEKVLLLYYEDMKGVRPILFKATQDLHREVKKLGDFLEVSRSDEFYEAVTQQTTFSKMKKNRDSTAPDMHLALYKDRKSKTYRKGEVGDWMSQFTVDQSERFDVAYAERMKQSNLKLRFTL